MPRNATSEAVAFRLLAAYETPQNEAKDMLDDDEMRNRGGMVATEIALCLAMTSPSRAVDARLAKSLLRIDLDTRLEQVCDIEAMHRIGRNTGFVPDRAKSDISSHPIHMGDALSAPGAAFRSKGKWYALSFDCKGTPDHLAVLSFSFMIGGLIPKNQWADLGLWQ